MYPSLFIEFINWYCQQQKEFNVLSEWILHAYQMHRKMQL